MTIVLAVCAAFSIVAFYVAYRNGTDSAFIFLAFGLFFLSICGNFIFRTASSKKQLHLKEDEETLERIEPTYFIPHWFMIAAVVVILASTVFCIIIYLIR